jgi:hypothetical protein
MQVSRLGSNRQKSTITAGVGVLSVFSARECHGASAAEEMIADDGKGGFSHDILSLSLCLAL